MNYNLKFTISLNVKYNQIVQIFDYHNSSYLHKTERDLHFVNIYPFPTCSIYNHLRFLKPFGSFGTSLFDVVKINLFGSVEYVFQGKE